MERPLINIDELRGRKPAVANSDLRYLKWRRWLDDIDRDLTDVAITRYVWKAIVEVLNEHPAMPPSHMFDVLTRSYAVSQSVAVRRQAEIDSRSVTMGRLLNEISQTPQALSREGFVGLLPWGMQHLGDEQFNQWAAPGAAHVDGDIA
jgi:hypothetical protein